jgi:hypothetical protein
VTGTQRIPPTSVLIHGAGDSGWYRHPVTAESHARGFDTLASYATVAR